VKPSLTDTPGGEPDATRRGGRGRRAKAKARARQSGDGGRLDFGPKPIPFVESRPDSQPQMFEPKRHIDVGLILATLFGLGTLAFVALIIYRGTRVEVDQEGIEDGDAVNGIEAAQMEVSIDLGSEDKAESARLMFDGEAVAEPEVDGERIVWRPVTDEMTEGDHSLELEVPRPVLGAATFTWDFTVDLTAPELEVPPVVEPVAMGDPAQVSGQVGEDTRVTADGNEVDVEDDGTFTLDFSRPPAGPIAIHAIDEADNTTEMQVVVPVAYPGLRGVHVTGPAWESEQLRGGILRMIDERRIDTVVIDLKDEGGTVHYDSGVRRVQEIGASTAFYDLDELVEALDARRVRIVGRISAFRDPRFAQAAWGAGRHEQVVQVPGGAPYGEPAEYTNFADAAVRQYNLDIALEAVERGVDDILWDDVRRPSGDAASVVLPGMTGSAADEVVGFLAEAHAALRRRGAFQGVTVEGAAADRGQEVGQDVARIARNADYVAPMIFPGYWSAGQYDVPNPVTQPGDLVRRLLDRYKQVTAGSGAVLAPWLQDFTVGGVGYGDGEVRAQIDATRAVGVNRFLLWDPAVSYSAGALDPAR
jgi:hypothetical protein